MEAIAKTLRTAYENCQPCAPVSETFDVDTLEKAYEIQEINNQFWIQKGRRPIGRKIGLTSKAVQQQLGVDNPDFGMLFDDMSFGTGDEIDISKLIQPKAEAEICLVLGKDLNNKCNSLHDIISATDYVLPALEIVDSRIADWKIKIFDTIADNASSALFVLGSQAVPVAQVDFELCGMVIEKKGEPVSTGAGIACLGNPLNAAVWLANKMVELKTPLKAGDIILTGALGPMVNIFPGDTLQARISGLGTVNIHFSKDKK